MITKLTLKLGDYRKIIAQITEYHKNKRIDIREFIDKNISLTSPDWIPTKRGISIGIDHWPETVIFFDGIKKILKSFLEQ